LHDYLFQPFASVAITLLTFAVLPWPGYALLQLAGFGRNQWPSGLLAGPAMTLAIWIILLSNAAWLSIPLRQVVWIVWAFTGLLGLFGAVAAYRSFGRRLPALSPLWLIAIALPFVLTPSIAHYGLGMFASSPYADDYAYIAVADYFTTIPRGVDSGLSVLHQYASHLMNNRNASSAILAQLAQTFGARADEAVSLYCMVIIFANAASLAAFASSIFEKRSLAIAYAVIGGMVPAVVIYCANLDQLLLLPLLPLAGAIALRTTRASSKIRAGAGFGILMAAAVLAYIELAFIGVLAAASFLVKPGDRLRASAAWAGGLLAFAAPTGLLLTAAGIVPLLREFVSLFEVSSQQMRPGDGQLAAWLVSGEIFHAWWIFPTLVAIAALAAVTILGIALERRRWACTTAAVTVIALAIYFLLYQRYLYAVYKIISINFWLLAYFTVVGGQFLLSRFASARQRRIGEAACAMTLAVLVLAVGYLLDIKQRGNADAQIGYREALKIAAIADHQPILVSVLDDRASLWAVFYLSDNPLRVSPYRSSMAQAHLVPVMARAKPVAESDIRYLITDRVDTGEDRGKFQRSWDGQVYSLWRKIN
jgi:hypothetical protein